MHTRVISPENVLGCLKAIGTHLDTPEKKGLALGDSASMRLARRLAGIRSFWDERGRLMWEHCWNWRNRLRLAGIDPATWEVTDAQRWALAWQQLIGNGRFYPEVQKRSIEMGHIAPEPADHILMMGRTVRKSGSSPAAVRQQPDDNDPAAASPEPYVAMLQRSIRRHITNR